MLPRSPLALAVVSLALFACSSSTDTSSGAAGGGSGETPDGDDDPAFVESELRACNDNYARTWFVTLNNRSCGDVLGYRGTWIATPLEEGASDAVCTMTWRGEKHSRADMSALRAFVTEEDAMTAACGAPGKPEPGVLTPIERLDFVGMAGANGCDVCGKLRRDGRIVVVLPPYRTFTRQFAVPLSNGSYRAFQIEAPQSARAVSLELPALPAGVTYAASRVTVH